MTVSHAALEAAERIATLEQERDAARAQFQQMRADWIEADEAAGKLIEERDTLRAVLIHLREVIAVDEPCQAEHACGFCVAIMQADRVLGKVDSLPATEQAHE